MVLFFCSRNATSDLPDWGGNRRACRGPARRGHDLSCKQPRAVPPQTKGPMPRVLRQTLLSLRDLAITAGPFLVLALALLAAAYYLLDPTPPRHVVLASGPAQSDY